MAELGYPVVVKPLNANHGRGVSINLCTPEEVAIAYEHAEKRGHRAAVSL